MSLTCDELLSRLHALADPANVAGMARFGIRPAHPLGTGMPALRELARGQKKDHALALCLWGSGIHEARILAALLDNPKQVTPDQMEAWAADFDTWDICDQVTGNLFDRTPYAWEKALAWSAREEEFVRRAGFALMAWLAVHAKKAPDEDFLVFIPAIRAASTDNRNFVRKAVNWALRQIGKRSPALRQTALAAAGEIAQIQSPAARWIAADAIKELSEAR